jgi:TolB protein
MATNGPLLLVDVNGKAPGAEFPWTRPMRVKVKIQVHSQEPVERVEVIFNGKVVGNQASATVAIPEPGWLAVRCFGPAGDTIRYAHSSPFYFPKDGQLPVKKEDAERWANYIHKLAEEAKGANEKAQATFREAEAIYRKKGDRRSF